ncbi:MAG TPA: hypothetical protein VGS22_12100 [Thermoanaerobaculia bacterium]|jgi:hypothetical protein|nr:hypothetical protein [Thermoanaerobaculia bacterium]
MSRRYSLLAVVTLAALLIGTVPAAAAPAAGWSFFDSFSPLNWIRHLWAENGSEISPWDLSVPAGGGIAPLGSPRALWAEEGSSINPWGLAAPVMNNTGTEISPWGLQ